MESLKVSVVLPSWNEGANLVPLVEALLAIPELCELIVVDDASTDRTGELWARSPVSREPRVRFVGNAERVGLARSIQRGLRLAAGSHVLVRDSDWNHDIADTAALIREAGRGADLVVASRYVDGARPVGRANDLLSIVLNGALRARHRGISDWTLGYFLARRELLRGAPAEAIFRGRGEYLLRLYGWLLRTYPDLRLAELPTRVRPRGQGRSTTRPVRHGLAYLDVLAREIWLARR